MVTAPRVLEVAPWANYKTNYKGKLQGKLQGKL